MPRPTETLGQFTAGMRRAGVREWTRDERAAAGTVPDRTPGTWLHVVKQIVDGKRRTKEEAAATFAGRPWAKRAVYVRVSGGYFCFEIPLEVAK